MASRDHDHTVSDALKARPNQGPWLFSGANGYSGLRGHRVSDPRGYILAVAIGDIPELASEANARLIAAAPDLLEALKASLAFIEDEADNRSATGSEHSDYEREPRELADRLRAAIAKAGA